MIPDDHKILLQLLESHAHLMVAVKTLIDGYEGDNRAAAMEAFANSTEKMMELIALYKGKNEES